MKIYNNALEYSLSNKVSELLNQLMTFHTIFCISGKPETYISKVEEMIKVEVECNINNIYNVKIDGGKIYDIDFFIEKYCNSNQIEKESPKEEKLEWGKDESVRTTIKKVEIITDCNFINLVSMLGYANGSGITRMLNSAKSTMINLRPYSSISSENAIIILSQIKQFASVEKLLLINKAINKIDGGI